jgi:hypothetical protein
VRKEFKVFKVSPDQLVPLEQLVRKEHKVLLVQLVLKELKAIPDQLVQLARKVFKD